MYFSPGTPDRTTLFDGLYSAKMALLANRDGPGANETGSRRSRVATSDARPSPSTKGIVVRPLAVRPLAVRPSFRQRMSWNDESVLTWFSGTSVPNTIIILIIIRILFNNNTNNNNNNKNTNNNNKGTLTSV